MLNFAQWEDKKPHPNPLKPHLNPLLLGEDLQDFRSLGEGTIRFFYLFEFLWWITIIKVHMGVNFGFDGRIPCV